MCISSLAHHIRFVSSSIYPILSYLIVSLFILRPRLTETLFLELNGTWGGERKKVMSKPLLRILCFGDSLTAGWPSAHPYAGKLEEKLEAALPHLQPICEVDGVPGNRVAHGSYRKRMERAWQRRSNSTSSSGSGSASYRSSIGSNSSSNSNDTHHHHHQQQNQQSREQEREREGGGAEEQTAGPPSSSATDSEDARSRPKYDWTIVLGGTNDLAWKVSPNDVVDGLRRTWGIPLSRGGKVLALTIPEVGVGYFPKVDEARDDINEAIREYKRPNL